MEVPITRVAVDDRPRIRVHRAHGLRRALDELRQATRRHRHVELVRHPLGVDDLGVALAQLPQPMPAGLVVGDHGRIRQATGFERDDELVGDIARGGPGFDEQVEGMAFGERRRHPGVTHDQLQARIGEQLERLDRCQRATQRPRAPHGGSGIREADDGDGPPIQPRDEPQPHRGDDREGALAAREQAGEVVSGVVLGHPREASQDRPVGQDGLEATDALAHRSVPEHVDPACVGGDHPADGGRVARGEVHPDVPARLARGRLDRGQDRPRTDGDFARVGVNRADLRQPAQRHDDLAATRHRSTDETRVAALGNDGHPGRMAGAQHGDDLIGAAGADHGERLGPEPPRPIGLVSGAQRRIGQAVGFADDLGQPRDECLGHAPMLPRPGAGSTALRGAVRGDVRLDAIEHALQAELEVVDGELLVVVLGVGRARRSRRWHRVARASGTARRPSSR